MWIILVLAVLATIKTTLQGYFSRDRIRTGRDSLMLNGSLFASIALVISVFYLRKVPSVQILWYAIPMAVTALSFQLTYMLAMRRGPISLSVAMVGFNFVIPMAVGLVWYHEEIKLVSVIAIILMAASIMLINHKGETGKCKKGWLLLAIAACVLSGMSNSVVMVFSKSIYAQQKDELIIVSHAISAILSFAVAFFMPGRKEENGFYVDKKLLIGLLLIGASLGFYDIIMVEGLAKTANSGIFLSALNVTTLVSCTLFDGLIFKQKLNRCQWIGILVSMIAIVIANL